MKGLILPLVLATIIIATVKSDQEWSVRLLDPQGFRISAKHAVGIRSVSIQGKIFNKPILNYPNDEYEGQFNLQSNNWWTYDNLTAVLEPGDKTMFAIIAHIEGHDRPEPDDMTLDEYFIPLHTPRYPVNAWIN